MGKRQNARKRNQGKSKRRKPVAAPRERPRASEATSKEVERAMRLQRYLNAKAAAEGIGEGDPRDEWVAAQLMTRDLGELLAEADASPDLDPGERVTQLVEEAARAEDPDFAHSLLTKAVREDPNRVDAYLLLVMKETSLKKLGALAVPAGRLARKAEKEGTLEQAFAFYSVLGTAFFRARGPDGQRTFAEAVQYMEKAKSVGSNFWDVRSELLYVAAVVAIGRIDKARVLAQETPDDGSAVWSYLQGLVGFFADDFEPFAAAQLKFPQVWDAIKDAETGETLEDDAIYIASVWSEIPNAPGLARNCS